ncbi:hypothetical protein JKF63_06292 [Porcisia hertigi]|uniref:Peptidase S8/S53 domain-containing protein n=1 Tax=Porcisia hertigi TaxID=2761500 RepID=A0A836LG97_9TRYP|nr:hypothetical protein JKF63_06292 [Porcisia hertigi]
MGLAPDAIVRMFRVFDRQGRTHRRYIARALDTLLREAEAVEAARVQDTWNTSSWPTRHLNDTVDVINLSYGSEDYYASPEVQDKLYKLMHEHGVIVVAAAGNDGARFGSVRSPADMPGVLAVGALRFERPREFARATRWPHAFDTDALDPPVNFSATGGGHKSVAFCSGRGPTTWELPFGAGRIKPDLVALGQHVWTVQGVTAATAAPQTRSVSSALQLRSTSGTSIAAPIVAGVVALCLEAARSSAHATASASSTTAGDVFFDVRHYRFARVSDSLRVREAIMRTAVPLKDIAPLHSNFVSTTASERHPRRVLAGAPLLKLYARYLSLSRLSILSQGMGEVQPLRALQTIVAESLASSNLDASSPLRNCASFAIPPSVHVGVGVFNGASGRGSDSMNITQSRRSRHGADGKPLGDLALRRRPGTSSAYWWPFADQLVYPGATPVLLNISLHMCPPSPSPSPSSSSSSSVREGGKGARFNFKPPYPRATFVFTRVRGCVRARDDRVSGQDRSSDDDCSLPIFPNDAQGHRGRRSANSMPFVNSAAAGPQHTQDGARTSVRLQSAPQPWMPRLLRVVSELTVVAGESPKCDGGRPQPPEQLSPPPTSFSLSVAVSTPLSAQTHLCYDVATGTVSMRKARAKGSRVRGNDTIAGRGSDDGDNDHGNRRAKRRAQVLGDPGRCVPLFHALRALRVEGALHIVTGGPSSSSASSRPMLTVPVVVRVAEPPPRAQRVLIDTSLDWPNPTTANSNLFIAGDDPHESPAGGVGVVPRCGKERQRHERAYAEANGGDHPHTNIALMWLYLRHTLGLVVEMFPLLHMSTINTSLEPRGNATVVSSYAEWTSNHSRAVQNLAAGALARVGTLIVIDPERPLTPDMRHLLTRAVLNEGANDSTDGLNVLLVTDWYSADVAAMLHWTRDESTEEAMGLNDTRDAVRNLLAQRHLDNGTIRGLAGSSHAPSWNRWLSEVSAASSGGARSGDCHGATSQSDTDLLDAMSELPFELSEDIVMDGVLVVDAAAPAKRNESEGSGAAVVAAAKTVAVRSLGQLNAAGVLQWRYPVQEALQQTAERNAAAGGSKEAHETSAPPLGGSTCSADHASKTSAMPSTQEGGGGGGEAVMCNVLPSWAQQQRRLLKRIIVNAGNGSAWAAVVKDSWESMPGRGQEKRLGRIKGLQTVENGARPPAAANASQVMQSLPYGVLGFLTLSPPPERTTTASLRCSRPGRITIFTDSDCLSTSDYHVQAVLDELEGYLYPPSASSSSSSSGAACATWDCFARTLDGQRLLQAESTQSSVCVEVVKEMLLWALTGNLIPWQNSSRLHCTTHRWGSAAHRCRLGSTPGMDNAHQDKAWSGSDYGGEAGTSFDDLLGTAPERAQVGEVVWRLWAASAEGTARDAASAAAERPTGETNLQRDATLDQWNAVEEVMPALVVRYHGDWRVHLEDCDTPPSDASALGNSLAQPAQRLLLVERLLSVTLLYDTLRWLLHPIVLNQLLLGAAASAGILLWRVLVSLWGRRH